MNEATARALFRRLKNLATKLFDVTEDDIQAYVLILVTYDGRVLESTNIMDNGQVSQVLAKAALDTRPRTEHVTDPGS